MKVYLRALTPTTISVTEGANLYFSIIYLCNQVIKNLLMFWGRQQVKAYYIGILINEIENSINDAKDT